MKEAKICMLIKNVDIELMQLIQETINKYNKAKAERDRKALGLV